MIEYLKTPPSKAGLADLAARLDEPPSDLVRKDARFKALGLNPDDFVTVEDVSEVLAVHPELLQRPLIDDGRRVVIARPPRKAEAWLADR